MLNMVHVSSPGKLMLAGEWSILEMGNPCIVTAIDKRVHAYLENSEKFSIEMVDFGINVDAELEAGKIIIKTPIGEDGFDKTRFAAAAIEVALQYLVDSGKSPGKFKVKIWKDTVFLDEVKTGFGYFASLISSVMGAVLSNSGIDITRHHELVFKLSAIAYYRTQGRGGSSYNLAAAIYGGSFVYRRFDGEWLKNEMDMVDGGKEKIKVLAEKPWPGVYLKEISIPKDMELCIGITGEPVSSIGMVKQMNNFKHHNPLEYESLVGHLRNTVDYLQTSITNRNQAGILEMISKSQKILRELGEKSGIDIETPKIRRLCWIASRHGGAGKLSGAGKSDMGIAVCFSKEDAMKIKKEWSENGIIPFDAEIDKEGIKVEKP
jgi:phosphomevalonate kinase